MKFTIPSNFPDNLLALREELAAAGITPITGVSTFPDDDEIEVLGAEWDAGQQQGIAAVLAAHTGASSLTSPSDRMAAMEARLDALES